MLKAPDVLLLLDRVKTHFCLRSPIKSCKPIRAKTLRKKKVRSMASRSFFTDWMTAPKIVLKPAEKVTEQLVRNSQLIM